MRTFHARAAIIAALIPAALIPAAARAAPVVGIDALKEWNLVVLGDLVSSSEVEGRTFVGGNLTGNSSNYQIRTPAASPYGLPGLIVVGDVTGGTKNLNNGSGAIVGGNVASGFNLNGATQTVRVGGTIANTNVNQNVVRSGLAASETNFTSGLATQKSLLVSSLTDLSTGLAGRTANSQVTIANNRATFDAKPDANGVAVFSLTAADLDRFGEIRFNTNGADTAIVNVSGTAIRLNDNFLGGTNGLGQNVIWNFPDATTLDLTTAWGGSVLAPRAQGNTANYIEGSAVFGGLVQNGEFHLGTYAGNYAPPATNTPGNGATQVPEPGSLAIMAVGLGLLGLLLGRRRMPA